VRPLPPARGVPPDSSLTQSARRRLIWLLDTRSRSVQPFRELDDLELKFSINIRRWILERLRFDALPNPARRVVTVRRRDGTLRQGPISQVPERPVLFLHVRGFAGPWRFQRAS